MIALAPALNVAVPGTTTPPAAWVIAPPAVTDMLPVIVIVGSEIAALLNVSVRSRRFVPAKLGSAGVVFVLRKAKSRMFPAVPPMATAPDMLLACEASATSVVGLVAINVNVPAPAA